MVGRDTANTTRIGNSSAIKMAVEVTKMLWPLPHVSDSPRVIVLVPDHYFPFSFAASSLLQKSIRGALLFSAVGMLPEPVRQEMQRLDPAGTRDVPSVIMVGPFHRHVINTVEKMGYSVLDITGKDIFSLAANIARFRKEVPTNSLAGDRCLFLVSGENPAESLFVPYYASYAGVPILFTYSKHLPAATARVLQEMKDKSVYVVGSRHAIAAGIMQEIADLTGKNARQISGEDLFAVSIAFARFYDPATDLGWRHVKERDDAFVFSNAMRWDLTVAGIGLAGHGKVAPLLPVGKNYIHPETRGYLSQLRSARNGDTPSCPHGYILGTSKEVAENTQADLERMLQGNAMPEK